MIPWGGGGTMGGTNILQSIKVVDLRIKNKGLYMHSTTGALLKL